MIWMMKREMILSQSKVQLHSNLRALNPSTESTTSMAEDDILFSTSLSHEQCHRGKINSNVNKTVKKQ